MLGEFGGEHDRGIGACEGEREREVVSAERKTQSLFAAVHMLDRIGDRFEGTIQDVDVKLAQPGGGSE